MNSSPKSKVRNTEANRSHDFEILKGFKCLLRSQERGDLNPWKWPWTQPCRRLSLLTPPPAEVSALTLATSRGGSKSSDHSVTAELPYSPPCSERGHLTWFWSRWSLCLRAETLESGFQPLNCPQAKPTVQKKHRKAAHFQGLSPAPCQ